MPLPPLDWFEAKQRKSTGKESLPPKLPNGEWDYEALYRELRATYPNYFQVKEHVDAKRFSRSQLLRAKLK